MLNKTINYTKEYNYHRSAEDRCKILGWRTDLMSTYIINDADNPENYNGHKKEQQDLIYSPTIPGKTYTPRGIE